MDSQDHSLFLAGAQYFLTPPHACSYISGRLARMVFLDPEQPINMSAMSDLSRSGFRRSGDFIYRPECSYCRQCLSSRIPVNLFQPNSSQKKALRKNKTLRITTTPCNKATDVHYMLFKRYIEQRHADGDMYPPSREQFDKFLVENATHSFFMEFWLDNQLIIAAACDPLDDGMSAVYTFFEPDLAHLSLGSYAILQQIEWIKQQGLDYLYLGYWVPHSPKMNYKSKFTPLEVLIDGDWRLIKRQLSDSETETLGNTLVTQRDIEFDQ